eukprot:3979625-Amphidinium_carterae.1
MRASEGAVPQFLLLLLSVYDDFSRRLKFCFDLWRARKRPDIGKTPTCKHPALQRRVEMVQAAKRVLSQER